MVKISTHYMRTTNFAILSIAMVAWIVALAGVLYLVLTAVPQDQEQRNYFLGLAWLTMGVLAVSLILLVGIIAHHAAGRLNQPTEPFKTTKYEDAWTEAGRRLKPEDAPPVEGFEEEDNSG
ncbi:MAG: hypothetical protein SVV80_03025 [Planctomycetota bacterium]|nr:hypothetical protein [Planctomycetota bacterium]